ncbi:MAG: hypothetical protein MUP14_09110, partial [Dehalococcoidia bacterium]|nr:hypothetical protein [Dehalococcoidia bacterium]
LDPDQTVLETVEAAASRETASQARNLLGCFLFRGDDVFKKVGVLSGGERSLRQPAPVGEVWHCTSQRAADRA